MQIAKWGNSLAVRLPKALITSMDLKVGDEVIIRQTPDRTLELERANRKVRALKALSQIKLTLPADYRFDRDQANER